MSVRTINDVCWLRLANGWTVSLSDGDTPPAICSVAAWPTRQDNLAGSSETFRNLALFDFGIYGTDRRCWSYADVREVLKVVAEAPSPISDLVSPGVMQ